MPQQISADTAASVQRQSSGGGVGGGGNFPSKDAQVSAFRSI